MVSNLSRPEPAPAERNAGAQQIFIEDRSYARLEYDYNEELKSRKRQKNQEAVNWLLQMESEHVPAQAMANAQADAQAAAQTVAKAAPEEEEKEPAIKIPDVSEAKKRLRSMFKREKGEPICLVCFFRASEIMFRKCELRNQEREVLELIRKLWTDWREHEKKVTLMGKPTKQYMRHDSDVVCDRCGNFLTLAVTDLKFT